MRVVADAHALIWYLRGDLKLSATALAAMQEAEDTDGIVVSAATLIDLWYVSQTTGAFTEQHVDEVRRLVGDPDANLIEEPVTAATAAAFGRIPLTQLRDPWDRLLVATALDQQLPIVTRDRLIRAYLATRGDDAPPAIW